jgi:hypothetical protein
MSLLYIGYIRATRIHFACLCKSEDGLTTFTSHTNKKRGCGFKQSQRKKHRIPKTQHEQQPVEAGACRPSWGGRGTSSGNIWPRNTGKDGASIISRRSSIRLLRTMSAGPDQRTAWSAAARSHRERVRSRAGMSDTEKYRAALCRETKRWQAARTT